VTTRTNLGGAVVVFRVGRKNNCSVYSSSPEARENIWVPCNGDKKTRWGVSSFWVRGREPTGAGGSNRVELLI